MTMYVDNDDQDDSYNNSDDNDETDNNCNVKNANVIIRMIMIQNNTDDEWQWYYIF